jgi:hypothetical protein
VLKLKLQVSQLEACASSQRLERVQWHAAVLRSHLAMVLYLWSSLCASRSDGELTLRLEGILRVNSIPPVCKLHRTDNAIDMSSQMPSAVCDIVSFAITTYGSRPNRWAKVSWCPCRRCSTRFHTLWASLRVPDNIPWSCPIGEQCEAELWTTCATTASRNVVRVH